MLSVPMHVKELGFTHNAAGRSLASRSDGEGVGIVFNTEEGWYDWYLLGMRVSCYIDPYINSVT